MFEDGKEYKTRGGRRARVYATDGTGLKSVHGAYECKGGWEPMRWTVSGKVSTHNYNNNLDLMPPVREWWLVVNKANPTRVYCNEKSFEDAEKTRLMYHYRDELEIIHVKEAVSE